ncbi:hypothetical protein CRENBAI_026867 [Crenichthys baileyi]|uniref:Basic proline-rich protein-like n=1 Tax=Crenichthys baileyi TaxID=28760 RepID=A0AAV9RP36_9TELE
MDPENQDPGTRHPQDRGPTEPRGPGPGRQPPGVSQYTPKHPAPDTENHNKERGPGANTTPRPLAQQGRPPGTAPHNGPPTPQHDGDSPHPPRSPGSVSPHAPQCPTQPQKKNFPANIPGHCSSPGENTIQLSSTIQPIQTPATPFPRSGYNPSPPKPPGLQPLPTPPPPTPRPPPSHMSPAEQPPPSLPKPPPDAPSPPAHESQTRGIHALAGYLGHTPQTRPTQTTAHPAPVQSQDAIRRPTHRPGNWGRAPNHGPEPQKHGRRPRLHPFSRGTRPPPPPNPGSAPPPRPLPPPPMAHHGPPKLVRPGQPPLRGGHIPKSCRQRSPLPNPGHPSPPGRPGPKARGRDPRETPSDPRERAETPAPSADSPQRPGPPKPPARETP